MRRLITTMIFLGCATARADYHYASHEGSDEYPFTSWETAADSIQEAIDAAEAGDTIYVGSGVWEDGPYNLSGYLALIGAGMDSTTTRGSMVGGYSHLNLNTHCSVEGFKFENCRTAVRASLYDSSLVIRNNSFINNYDAIRLPQNSGQIINNIFRYNEGGIDAYFDACDLIVKNNVFDSLYEFGIIAYNGNWEVTNNLFCYNPRTSSVLLAINVQGPSYSAYVANNLFYRNYQFENNDNQELIWIWHKVYLENNTIIGWEDPDRFIAVFAHSAPDSSIDLRNNTIVGFKAAVYAAPYPGGSTVKLYYNDFWNNQSDVYYQSDSVEFVEGNVWADPMFADTTSFRLQMYSPLIDAGDPNILDVDGTRSDIGCYGGPGGCSYVYLDLAPQIPDSITVEIEEDMVILDWRFNTEADFNRYQIFRDTTSGFEPSEFNMIAEPDTSYYEDDSIEPGTAYYYRLTAVDNQGNVSDYSEEVAVIPTGNTQDDNGTILPRYTVIESAYPNPFNSDVTIVYSASNLGPQPPQIKLQIFDVQGRLVKTLVDERKPMGTYRVVWDGRDDTGWPVSSGVYFARLSQWDCPAVDFPVKITLVK